MTRQNAKPFQSELFTILNRSFTWWDKVGQGSAVFGGSDFDVDALAIQQPHQEQEEQYEADGIGERSVDRLEQCEKHILHRPFLQRPGLAIRPGDLIGRHHPCEKARENKKCQSVRTKDHKRPCPCPIAFDIDEPVAAAESQKTRARRWQARRNSSTKIC